MIKFLSLYLSLLFLASCVATGTVTEYSTKKISDKAKYKDSYIKNLTKECFSKAYMKNSSKGLAGGILTNKALRVLSHL